MDGKLQVQWHLKLTIYNKVNIEMEVKSAITIQHIVFNKNNVI